MLKIILLCMILLISQQRITDEDFQKYIENILNSHLVEGNKWGLNFHFYRPGL